MVNGALHVRLHPRDLAFEGGDAPFELADRQRIEILPDQERDRIAGARKILVGIHGADR